LISRANPNQPTPSSPNTPVTHPNTKTPPSTS
jgi:hypothetical protein